MSTTDPAPDVTPPFGLFQSRTVLALLAALVTSQLPHIENWLGIAAADQPQFTALVQQLGTPILLLMGIYFRAAATKKVTHVLTAPATKSLALLAIIVALPVCLSLGACATTPQIALDTRKADAVAWSSLDAVALSLDGFAKAHVLHGDTALKAADLLQRATSALTAADSAIAHNDTATAQQNVDSATALVAQLVAIAQNPTQ